MRYHGKAAELEDRRFRTKNGTISFLRLSKAGCPPELRNVGYNTTVIACCFQPVFLWLSVGEAASQSGQGVRRRFGDLGGDFSGARAALECGAGFCLVISAWSSQPVRSFLNTLMRRESRSLKTLAQGSVVSMRECTALQTLRVSKTATPYDRVALPFL